MKRLSLIFLAFFVLVLLVSTALVFTTSGHAASPRNPAPHKPRTIFPTRDQQAKQQGTLTAHAVQGSGDLVYHGGSALGSPEVFLTFWGPGWSSSPDVQIIKNYFNDVGSTSFENILTQYYSFFGVPLTNTFSLNGVWIDSSTPPTDHTCGGPTIQDSAIRAEINRAITQNGWVKTGNSTFFVYTPNNYYVNDGFNDCSEKIFCGYHGYASLQPYAVIAYPFNLAGCGVPSSPNGDIYGDSLVNISSHEQFESITDPDVSTGWYDGAGFEIGDKCAFDFSSGLTHLNNNGTFLIQTEYSNVSSSCVNTYTPGAFIRSSVPIAYFVSPPGQNGWTQPLVLYNTGPLPLNWTAGSLPSWVKLSATSGSIQPNSLQQLSLTANAPNGPTQTYSANLTITAPNTINAPFTLPIAMQIANVSRQWYFAEGYTGGNFTEFLTIASVAGGSTDVQVKYLLGSGPPIIKNYLVDPGSRYTINVNNEIGAGKDVSIVVTANGPIVVERPIYFTYQGIVPGGSDVLGATSLATNFDFGYLDTSSGYNTYLTILNQNPTPLTATINYFQASGGAPITRVHTVNANSRGTVYVNADNLPPGQYSALVSLSAPGLVERPLYFKDSSGHTGSADVVGVATPLTDWYFAEGFTSSTFNERYILSNPSTTATAQATVTFLGSNGATVPTTVNLAPGQQQIISANSLLGNGNVSNSAVVHATQPILAERFMSFTYVGLVGTGSQASIPGATDVLGAAAPSNLFYFAEGYTGGQFAEYLTIENPSQTSTAVVQVIYLTGTRAAEEQVFAIPPSSRFTLFTNAVSYVRNWSFSMVVQSNIPIVAERPMYFNFTGGQTGGSDVIGYQPPGAAPAAGSSVYIPSNFFDAYVTAVDSATGGTRWSSQIGGPAGFVTQPVIANGVGYVGVSFNTINPPNAVDAFNTSDGSLLWSVPMGFPSAPVVVGGVVFVSSAESVVNVGTVFYVYALNVTTGATIWKAQVSARVSTDLAVANGLIYYGSDDGHLYALKASDGSPLWNYPTGGSIYSPPVIANGVVAFGSNDTYVYALDASTGALVWKYQTGGQVGSHLALANGTLYFTSTDGYLYALNISTGTFLWRVVAGGGSPAVDNGMVFLASGSGMFAYDASTGATLWSWSYSTGFFGPPMSTVAVNGVLYVSTGTPGKYLFALQESDGSLLWGTEITLDAPPTIAP